MKQANNNATHLRPAATAPGSEVILPVLQPPPRSETASTFDRGYGIQVHEDELGSATAQCMYRMRCQCGRAWFELELPKLVQCPACLRLSVVDSGG